MYINNISSMQQSNEAPQPANNINQATNDVTEVNISIQHWNHVKNSY